jgi:GcrA cell cycle regulator
MSTGTPWSDADNARLRMLWDEGHTTGVLAREFGRTRNGIIGRARRLHLAPRPSPIPGHVPAAPRPVAPPPPPPVVVALPAPLPRPAPVRSCQYPHGHPREPGFRYCGAPALPGWVYCREHQRLCYQHRLAA